MRLVGALNIVYVLSFLGKAVASMSCTGTADESRGRFCFDPSKDVDSLISSLAQTGFSTEALSASKPRRVQRVDVPQTTTTTAAPTTPAPTGPPARRRAVPTGFATCEDINGPDILDTDCWIARYQGLTGQIFPLLGAMSALVSTGRVYSAKLQPVLGQIKIPMLQSSLGTAIKSGISEFDGGLSSATNAVNYALSRASGSTGNLVSGLERTFSDSISASQSETGRNFDGLHAVEMTNINSLIDRANQINQNSAASQVLELLEDIGSNAPGQLRNHSDFVNSIVGNFSTQKSWLLNEFLLKTTDFAMSKIPQVTGSTALSSTARSAGLLANNSASIIKALDAAALGNAANISNRISGTISQENKSMSNWVNSRIVNSASQIQTINSQVGSLNSQVAISSNLMPSQLSQIAAPSLSSSSPFSSIGSSMTELAQKISVNGTGSVVSWNIGARATLTSLNQLLSSASSALKSGVNSGAGKSANSITKTILRSLAQVGNVQTSLTNSMLNNQQTGINAVNKVIRNLTDSGVSFKTMMQTITNLISMMNTSSNVSSAASPLDAFMNLPSTLQRLSINVTDATVNATSALDVIKESINANISTYLSNLTSFWNNQSSLSKGFYPSLISSTGSNATSLGGANITKFLNKLVGTQQAAASASGAAIKSNIQTADSAASQQSIVSNTIADTLSHISRLAAYAMSNISNVVTLGPSNYSSLWKMQKGGIDATSKASSAEVADLQNERVNYPQKLATFNSSIQPIGDEAKSRLAELGSFSGDLAKTKTRSSTNANQDISKLTGAVEKESANFASSLVQVERSMESGPIAASRTGVAFTLSSLGKDSFADSSSLNQRIAKQVNLLTSLNATMEDLVNNILNSNNVLSSNTNAADNLVVLVQMALYISQILQLEINALVSGQLAATSLDSEIISRINASMKSEIASIMPRANIDLSTSDWASFVQTKEAVVQAAELAALGATNYTQNRPVDYRTTFTSNLSSSILDPLANGILAAAEMYSASRNGTTPTMDQINVVKAYIEGTLMPRLGSETATLSAVLSQVSAFANSSLTNKQLLLNTLSVFDAQLLQTQGVSMAQAAALVANASASLQQAISTMNSISNVAELVGSTQAAETQSRMNSVESVQSRLLNSDKKVSSLLRNAIADAASANEGLGREANERSGETQLAAKVSGDLRLMGSTFKTIQSKIQSSANLQEDQMNVSLSALARNIDSYGDELGKKQREMIDEIQSWRAGGAGSDIEARGDEIQHAISQFSSEANIPSLDPNSFASSISSLETPPLAFATVEDSVKNVDIMLAKTRML